MHLFRKNRLSQQDRELLREAIAYLETKPTVEYDPRSSEPAAVMNALGLLEPDYDYLSHKSRLDERGVAPEDMTPEEIATMLTFYQRGERFCDGFIVSAINSGELLPIFRRLEELTK